MVSEEDIRNVCKIILKLYTRPKPDQERLEEVIAKLVKESESTRKKPSIISQLSKSTNDTQPANNHVKRVKVEHIIQVPDGKRQLNSTIEVKEIKDLKEDDRRRWKSQERNHSGSPGQTLKRSRSRSKSPERSRDRSREISRRKYASKEYRDAYSYHDYPSSKDYYSGRDYAGKAYASSKDYAGKEYREYSSKDYYDTRHERNGRFEEKNDRYDDRRHDESRYEESRYNGRHGDKNDKYDDWYNDEYYRKSGRERSSKSRRDAGR